MTTKRRPHLPARMTRERWHVQRSAGFLRWFLPRSVLWGSVFAAIPAAMKPLRESREAFDDGWFMRFGAEYLAQLPLYLLIALCVFALLWLHFEEEFFHKPPAAGDGGP